MFTTQASAHHPFPTTIRETQRFQHRSKSLPNDLATLTEQQSEKRIKETQSEPLCTFRKKQEVTRCKPRTGYLKDNRNIRKLSETINSLPVDSKAYYHQLHELHKVISRLIGRLDIRLEDSKFPGEVLATFTETIQNEVISVCLPVENFLNAPSHFDWGARENQKCREIIEATQNICQFFNQETYTFIDALILTYDFYQTAYSNIQQLLRGQICDLNIRPTQQSKALDLLITYKKQTLTFAGMDYLHRMIPSIPQEVDDLHPNLVTMASNMESIISGRMHIYFSLSRTGYELLGEYIHSNGATKVVEPMAGTGYTAAHLSQCELSVRACDNHPRREGVYFPVEKMDAIDFIKELARRESIENAVLLICAPPPHARVTGSSGEIRNYLTHLYKAWHENQGKFVILFSECCDEQTFHSQHLLKKENIAIKEWTSSLPDEVIEDAGEFSGTAKAFQIISYEQAMAERQDKDDDGYTHKVRFYIGDDPSDIL